MTSAYLIWGCLMWFLTGTLIDNIILSNDKTERVTATLLFMLGLIFAVLNTYLAVR